METIIKVNPSELNSSLIDKIKNFIGGKNNVDVTILLKEFDAGYAEDLDRSIEDAETGQQILSFSMEDFMAYTPAK